MMRKYTAVLSLLVLLCISGCSQVPLRPEADATEKTLITTSSQTTASIQQDSVTASSATETLAVPTLPANTSGKVEIRTISGSLVTPLLSFLITSADGQTVVLNPAQMPTMKELLIDPILIATTSTEDDQNDPAFIDSYTCEKIESKAADVTVGDFHVYSIRSSYRDDTISDFSGNNLVVVEVNGLRIVHMGDVGQTYLTDEQIKQLGEIDIAFMQFENTRSGMTLKNEKGFTLIEQLNPKIIIPTRFSENAISVLTEKYGEITYYDDVLAISSEDLPEDTMHVCILKNNYLFD